MADGYEIQTVSRVTGVPVATLNVWINRSLLAAPKTRRGRARLFDVETVFQIALLGVLVPLNQPAPFAAKVAYLAREKFERPGATAIVGPPRHLPAFIPSGMMGAPTVTIVEANSPDELEARLQSFSDGRPEAVLVVDLNLLAARVRRELEAFGGRREPTPEREAMLDQLSEADDYREAAKMKPKPKRRVKRQSRG